MSDLLESNKGVKFEIEGEVVSLTFSTVKNYLTSGNEAITDKEAVMFMNLCKYQKLNPFLKEAYLVKFKGFPAQIITSKEAYMKKAEKNPNFDGFQAGLIVERDGEEVEIEGSFTRKKDTLLGGWAKVYRKDRKIPSVARVDLQEYDKGQSTWIKMTKTMIRKVAIVQALREAFPVDLGALYTEEEAEAINQANNIKNNIPKEEIKENANKKTLKIEKQEETIEENEEIEQPEIIVEEPENAQIKFMKDEVFEGPGW